MSVSGLILLLKFDSEEVDWYSLLEIMIARIEHDSSELMLLVSFFFLVL